MGFSSPPRRSKYQQRAFPVQLVRLPESGSGDKMVTMQARNNLEEALAPKTLIFGLTVQNIPTMNLRFQYAHDREIVFAEGLAERLHAWKFGQGDVTVTYADPDSYFTTLLRTTIVGIECTLQNSTVEELLFSNRLTEELRHAIRHPSILSRSMADAHYNKIPYCVNANAPLKSYDTTLWNTVQQFYREIRNPIFHGFQLTDVKPEPLRCAFRMFDDIFKWIDSWTDPHRVHKILASATFRPLKP
jgi:hypothetical protein